MRPVEEVLDLARWAPSGDNAQPWRFEIVDDRRVRVHAFDTRDHCMYDLDGRASQLAHGALLETMRIAATQYGWATRWERLLTAPENRPVFDVSFTPDASVEPSEWISAVRERCVQRRPMSRRAIRPEEKARLEAVLPAGYSLMWLEGSRRLEVARLLFANAKIRLTTREAFEVHRSVIEWGVDESEDRIPDRAVGLDPLTLRLMAWAMQDWRRVEFMNRWFAGTVAPRLQLDFLPGIACGAHVLLIAPTEPRTIDEYLAAGGAVQRFWLEATNAGLQHQPEMTPLIFARYVRNGLRFSESEGSIASATELARRCDAVFDAPVMKRGLWLGRLGDGPRATSRSVRLPLAKLLLPAKTGAGGAKAMA